jgi:hypothetical protein
MPYIRVGYRLYNSLLLYHKYRNWQYISAYISAENTQAIVRLIIRKKYIIIWKSRC